jgi:hypothetical protein
MVYDGVRVQKEKIQTFGNKDYHFYKTVYTRDQTELRQVWLRKRGYEFKIFNNGGDEGFDIYTYPRVSGR